MTSLRGKHQSHTDKDHGVGVDDNAKHRRKAVPHWRLAIGRLIVCLRKKSSRGKVVALSLGVCGCLLLLTGTRSGGGMGAGTVVSAQRVSHPRTVARSGRRLTDMGFEARPRSVGYYFEGDELLGFQTLDPYLQRKQRERSVYVREGEIQAQLDLDDSAEYDSRMPDKPAKNCLPQHDWQVSLFPGCNRVFESVDLTTPYVDAGEESDESVRLINNGYWRDVWMTREWEGTKQAFKTIRYEHGFEKRNYDRHRKDALASERLTSSPNVVDIYGFCGNSGVFEYTEDGDLDEALWPDEGDSKLTMMDKLKLAVQIARSIGDAHNFDQEGQSSLAHTDITPGQFLLIDGVYKLNDFNRARLIMWDKAKDKPCPYRVGNNPGKYRSPEEYSYQDQTEKVDIYSMGNIFFNFITGVWPFESLKTKQAQHEIKRGRRPPIDDGMFDSTDPVDNTIYKAMEMCWVQNPKERASARDVEHFLAAQLKKIETGELKKIEKGELEENETGELKKIEKGVLEENEAGAEKKMGAGEAKKVDREDGKKVGKGELEKKKAGEAKKIGTGAVKKKEGKKKKKKVKKNEPGEVKKN